jgi:hypothetical protein
LNKNENESNFLERLRKRKRSKSLNFSNKLVFLMNRIMIDELQKKKFFKIMNSKKYKNATQHDFNTFIRECRRIFEIRRHIYSDDKNKILFAKSFLESVLTKNWKKHQKIINIIFISWEQFIDFFTKAF